MAGKTYNINLYNMIREDCYDISLMEDFQYSVLEYKSENTHASIGGLE